MYRTNQAMDQNVENPEVNIEFLSRLSALPTVHLALGYVLNTYSKTKESNSLLNYTFNTAEKSISAVAEPVVNKLQTPIKVMDSIACKGLDKLEEKIGFIKVSPQDMVENTKTYCYDKVEESKNKYNDMKSYSTNQVVKAASVVLQSPYGKFVCDKVDDSLTIADKYVEHYLPGGEEAGSTEGDLNAYERAQMISAKVYNRLYKQAFFQLDHVQKNVRVTFAQLNIAMNLIEYLKKNSSEKVTQAYMTLQTQVNEIWSEMSKDEQGNENENLNAKLLYVTRRLTKNLMITLNAAVSASLKLPTIASNRIQESQTYATEMYSYFLKTSKIEEINEQVFDRFHIQAQHLQALILELCKYPVMNQAINLLKINKFLVEKDTRVIEASGEDSTEEVQE